ncbi:hypothetical protein BU14_0209s0029 [Porphyra umbilicalis]|uniref:Uncharacterized protein n=1 Tax=Porphyra umbilicalis TaxID=2786 RepID=A0A1X6P5B5_PORUM|nr:hypothetical protein BU14_0209s0029 [Porphyra umbilicalis]|eukprot:OSX76038.1 hypothetical protein BU14_0209s0029 [Porphyra umbilicalis]
MLSMGLTLSLADIRRGLSRPALLVASLLLCYGLMPALAVAIASAARLSAGHRSGLVLLGLISGGQASNLCVHIAGGDVALSVAMTTASTVGAAVAIPALAARLLSASVGGVGGVGLAATTARLVLAPVAAGAVANAAAPRAMRAVRPLLPAVGIVATVVVILGATARTAGVVGPALAALAGPVAALHAGGFVAGWAVAKALAAVGAVGRGGGGRGTGVARTLAFESGFKSPALAYVLAIKHFGAEARLAPAVSILVLAPLAAVAAALMRRFGARTPFSPPDAATTAVERE